MASTSTDALVDGILNDPELAENAGKEEEETVEIVGACKLMDGFFLGDAICAEVFSWLCSHFSFRTLNSCGSTKSRMSLTAQATSLRIFIKRKGSSITPSDGRSSL